MIKGVDEEGEAIEGAKITSYLDDGEGFSISFLYWALSVFLLLAIGSSVG